MGKDATKAKARLCKECSQLKYMTAAQLQEHAAICKAMNRLGLYVPGTETTNLIIPAGD